MTHLREAAQQALDAIRSTEAYKHGNVMLNEAAEDLSAALAEPVQEPVAWADMDVRNEDKGLSWTPGHFHKTPLYTAPPQSKLLTDEEIAAAYASCKYGSVSELARAIERAHGIGGQE